MLLGWLNYFNYLCSSISLIYLQGLGDECILLYILLYIYIYIGKLDFSKKYESDRVHVGWQNYFNCLVIYIK